MSLASVEERGLVRHTVRAWLARAGGMSAARESLSSHSWTMHDATLWALLATELGVQGIHTPTAYGGQGLSLVELATVFHELGRVVHPCPFLASVALAASYVAIAGSEADRRELLPSIVAGARVAALAIAEPGRACVDPSEVVLEATPARDGFRLDGAKTAVIDGLAADWILVVGRAPGTRGRDGLGVFLVDGGDPGLHRAPLPTLDTTRRQARVELRDAVGRPIGTPGEAWGAVMKTLHHATVCLANEMVGGAERALEMTLEYAKMRVQFGRSIGSFQAIKHRCADMFVLVESARSAAEHAAVVAAVDGPDLAVAASAAKAFCSDAFFRVAAETIQIHGGVGFTWEHDAHLFFKRAQGSRSLLGAPPFHREVVARALEL